MTPATLVFGTTTWRPAKYVYVRQGQDADTENEVVYVTHSATGDGYESEGHRVGPRPARGQRQRRVAWDAEEPSRDPRAGKRRAQMRSAGGRSPENPSLHYEYQQEGETGWTGTGGTETSKEVTGLNGDERLPVPGMRAVNSEGEGPASELSESVTPLSVALTASFEDVPAEHDGSSVFTLRLAFSEAVRTSFRVLRDQAVSADGGTVRRARRVDGRSDLWEIHVRPSGQRGGDGVAWPLGRVRKRGRGMHGGQRARCRMPFPWRSGSVGAVGGRRRGGGGSERGARLHGDAGPGGDGGGDRRVCDGERLGDGGVGLHGDERDAQLRRGGDGEDGVGAGDRRFARRGRRDADAVAVERLGGVDRGRLGDRDDREPRPRCRRRSSRGSGGRRPSRWSSTWRNGMAAPRGAGLPGRVSPDRSCGPAWSGTSRPGFLSGFGQPLGASPMGGHPGGASALGGAPMGPAAMGAHVSGHGVGAPGMAGRVLSAGGAAAMPRHGPSAGHGGGFLGSLLPGGGPFSQLGVRAEPGAARRGRLGVEPQLPVALRRRRGRAVAWRRRAHDDVRRRLHARRAGGRPVGRPHPGAGRLQRPERRADDLVDDRLLPVGGLPSQRPRLGLGGDRLRHRCAESGAGRRGDAGDGPVDGDDGGGGRAAS